MSSLRARIHEDCRCHEAEGDMAVYRGCIDLGGTIGQCHVRAIWIDSDDQAHGRIAGEDGYAARLRQARLRDLVTSRATATPFSEHYVGLARARLVAGETLPR